MYTSHSGNLLYDSKYFFFVGNRLIDNRSYLTAAYLRFPVGDQYYFGVSLHLFNDKYNIMHIT